MFANVARNVARNSAKFAPVARTSVRAFAASATKTAAKQPNKAAAAAAAATFAGAAAWFASDIAEAKSVPHYGVAGTNQERTFIAIKPDGVQRGLISEVIARFEKKGYKLVAMKMMTATKERTEAHYADLSKKPFFPGLVEYFSSGPIVCMVWEGTDVILTGRKILGATNPNQANPGTLRGDNCISTGRNLVHGSDGADSAKHEISMWFNADEVNDYTRALDTWIVADN